MAGSGPARGVSRLLACGSPKRRYGLLLGDWDRFLLFNVVVPDP